MIEYNEFELKNCTLYLKNCRLYSSDQKTKTTILKAAKKEILLEYKKGDYISCEMVAKMDFNVRVLYDPGRTLGVYRFEGLPFPFSWRDFVGSEKKTKKGLRDSFTEGLIGEYKFIHEEYNPNDWDKDDIPFFNSMKKMFKTLFRKAKRTEVMEYDKKRDIYYCTKES